MGKRVVVLAAFACDPNIPSEPTIGWAYLNAWLQLANAREDVLVLALMNERSKAASDARLREDGVVTEGVLETVGIALPKFLKFLENPYLTRLEYLVWSMSTRKHLRSLPAHHEVVLARHVTFASELLPTPISVLKGRALTVWGPVGSSGVASAFRIRPRHPQWRSQFALQKVRDLVSKLQSRKIGAGVDLVLTTSDALAKDLSAVGIQSQPFPNTRVDPRIIDVITKSSNSVMRPQSSRSAGRPLKLLCVGNLVYLKRFELAIATLTDPRLQDACLEIIGKPAPGKENYLLRVASELNVADRVAFSGQQTQEQVIRSMIEADVLIHPSTREGGSGVVGEATAVGVPVVCFQGTGAAVVLDFAGGHGIKVDATRGSSTQGLSDAVVEASQLEHLPATMWDHDRYTEKENELFDLALGQERATRL